MALAPDTISEISWVILAWRALLNLTSSTCSSQRGEEKVRTQQGVQRLGGDALHWAMLLLTRLGYFSDPGKMVIR